MKQLNQKKYDLMQLLYSQKNQWQSLVNVSINKMSDMIKSNAIWYRRMLKDKDIAMMKFRKEKDKEIGDLNQRWQDVVDQQDKTLHNEFQTELLSQSGQFEQKIGVLQGQVNDYSTNYMQTREHKEVLLMKEIKWTEERDKLLKVIGELESIAEDLEWKLQKSEKELMLQGEELSKEMKIRWEVQLRFNECDKRRMGVEASLKNQEFLNEKLKVDCQDLLGSLDSQMGKNEKDLEIKKKLEEQLLIRRVEMEVLEEEITQRKFQIQQNNNHISKQELQLEQRDKELKQKENEIIGLKRVIDQQDQRIRTMELNERDDLNEYFKNSQSNSLQIECLWKAKKDLQRDLQDNDQEHLQKYQQLNNLKKKVVEELFIVTQQLRERDRELKNEQRTVESLLATKKKLNQIIEDLNGKIEQLNDKIEELTLNLNNTKEEKNKIIQKFKEFRLSQLKQKKFQLVQTKKFMQDLQKEYMSFGYQIGQEIKQSNSELQKFVVEIAAKLQESSTQHDDELNQLRVSLNQQHEEDLNSQLYNEKERSRVQLDTAKQQMGSQIVQLNEQLKVLKKKLSNTGMNNNQLDQELFKSQNVMQFADQEIFDVKLRYKNIQGELDTIVLEFKGKYETIEQDHQNTIYSKQQVQQLKHFTDIQDVLSSLLLQLDELLKKYMKLNQQKEKDLKNSQAVLQSKLISSSRLMQSKSPRKDQQQDSVQMALIESFSPTHYQRRREQEIKEEEGNKNQFPTLI